MTDKLPRMLWVEDDPRWPNLCKDKLEQFCKVDIATSGDEMIDHLLHPLRETIPYRLLALDSRVPRSPGDIPDPNFGPKTVEDILSNHLLLPPQTPCIVFTAYGTISDCVRCIQAGADDYLLKEPPDPAWAFVKRCESYLTPYDNSDSFHDWCTANLNELKSKFSGKVIAIIDSIVSSSIANIAGRSIVICGDDYNKVMREVLSNTSLRWEFPQFLRVPDLTEERAIKG